MRAGGSDAEAAAAEAAAGAEAEEASAEEATELLVPQSPPATPRGRGVARFATDLPAKAREFDIKQSFQKFAFGRQVQLGIMKMGLGVPTRVQDVAIPQIMNGISVFMMAQTGTGKTLAYVLPIIHKLLDSNREGFHPTAKKPRAIIIMPTRELCMQTLKVLRYFPVKSMMSAPGHSFNKEVAALNGGIDIIVGTPFRLIIHLGKEDMYLKNIQHIVLDEADTLCDTFYKEDIAKFIGGLNRECAKQPQVVVVGATRTGAVSAFLRQHMSNTAIVPIATTDAHKTPAQVEQVFVPTRGKRLQACLWDVLAEVPVVGKKTLVFTNRVQSCKAVLHSMLEHGYSAVGLYGGIHPKRRKQVWTEFTGTGADVMVCTNLASRGLDFSNVHHVVMYEFPLNMADYLHRVGRTARGGRAGRVTTITPRRYWPFVVKIQKACAEGKPIEVGQATKHAKKLLAMENYMKVAQSSKVNKHTKRYIRKKLGLPPRRNLGSKETKAAMKLLDRRISNIKKMRFLQKRGILKEGHGIPTMPDRQVEASDSQTVSTLVRAKDGLLQVMPRRRRKLDTNDVHSAPAEPTGEPTQQPRAAVRRQQRPVM